MISIKNNLDILKRGKYKLFAFNVLKKFKLTSSPWYPFTLIVEPCNFCNLKCPTCPTGCGKMNRTPKAMDLEKYKKAVDEVKGFATKIVMFNYGESFLHPDIIEMIKYAVVRNIHVRVSTNGHFFTDMEYCKKVINTGLQEFIICLDALDNETANKVRPGADVEKVKIGIENMVRAKKELKASHISIEVLFLLNRMNVKQKEDVKKFAERAGVDKFQEKTIGIEVNDSEFQKIAKDFLPDDSELSRYYFDEKEKKYLVKGKIVNYCSLVNSTMVINSDGSVVPCCYDLYSDHVLGNAFESGVKNVWTGKKFQEFRYKTLTDKKSISMCLLCTEGRISDTINIKKELVSKD